MRPRLNKLGLLQLDRNGKINAPITQTKGIGHQAAKSTKKPNLKRFDSLDVLGALVAKRMVLPVLILAPSFRL